MSLNPHVIVIMADQLRHDFIRPEFAPRICALFSESAQFPRMYTASPLCVPARGSFFTGRYPNETGCLVNGWEPIDKEHGLVAARTPNLYTCFEAAGYDSWHTGKQHLHTADAFDEQADSQTRWMSLERGYADHLANSGARTPGGPRFTGICPELHSRKTSAARRYSIPQTGCYEDGFENFFDGYILKETLHAIEHRDRQKPFLLNAMFLAPHPPFDIPSPWYQKFKDVPMPENVGRWDPLQSPLNLYHMSGAIGARYHREEWQEPWRVYAGLVNLLDHCVGQIVDKLKAEGIYENSVIVFTSDHGEMLGSHCLWQKMVAYEESARTPLAIKMPRGKNAGVANPGPTSQVDVFPTLCQIAGIQIPNSVSGKSLLPQIEGRQKPTKEPVFIQSDGNGALEKWSRCVVDGNLKLIVDGFKDEVFFELYDLEADPFESRNLAFEQHASLPRFLATLSAHMQRTGDLLSLNEADYQSFQRNYAYQAALA
ncbi:sulfatase-like hydrolase/transferase [Pelagicoccus sp. SDUM812005]|uniref:sulfatase family protein n=1 Tax=Pelagicoccus sp. SDUM812005 TaxID=3041257 RepID=UPI00280F7160|nr:sulfatase-like hydrolase/transferase [Pelagicoccus sp. SDUM812005]MDQ8183603.1 sulfatase-like hydrolase/transferase [Pelagicoccus sp. SDUM812005]